MNPSQTGCFLSGMVYETVVKLGVFCLAWYMIPSQTGCFLSGMVYETMVKLDVLSSMVYDP